MDSNIKKANEIKINTVIKNMAKRNITGHYCDNVNDACKKIQELIAEGSSVAWGGSVTLGEIGIKEILNKGNYNVDDPMSYSDPQEALESRRRALSSDVFLTSANAVTMDGEIVNIDGTGNRVAAIVFGPKKVVIVVGANKLVPDEDTAYRRIRSDACPPNCVRLGKQTPCALTGRCGLCLSKGNTVCCHLVTTRFSSQDNRIHVVFVNEALGY